MSLSPTVFRHCVLEDLHVPEPVPETEVAREGGVVGPRPRLPDHPFKGEGLKEEESLGVGVPVPAYSLKPPTSISRLSSRVQVPSSLLVGGARWGGRSWRFDVWSLPSRPPPAPRLLFGSDVRVGVQTLPRLPLDVPPLHSSSGPPLLPPVPDVGPGSESPRAVPITRVSSTSTRGGGVRPSVLHGLPRVLRRPSCETLRPGPPDPPPVPSDPGPVWALPPHSSVSLLGLSPSLPSPSHVYSRSSFFSTYFYSVLEVALRLLLRHHPPSFPIALGLY